MLYAAMRCVSTAANATPDAFVHLYSMSTKCPLTHYLFLFVFVWPIS